MCVFVVVSGQDPFVFVGEGEEEERWNTFLFSNKEKKKQQKYDYVVIQYDKKIIFSITLIFHPSYPRWKYNSLYIIQWNLIFIALIFFTPQITIKI